MPALLTEDGAIDDVGVRHADLDRMSGGLDARDVHRHVPVGEDDITALVDRYLLMGRGGGVAVNNKVAIMDTIATTG